MASRGRGLGKMSVIALAGDLFEYAVEGGERNPHTGDVEIRAVWAAK